MFYLWKYIYKQTVATVVDRPPVCLDMDVNIASTSRIDENKYFQVMNIVIIFFLFKYIIFIMRPPDSDIVDVLTAILCIIIVLMQCEWFLSIIFRPQNLPVFRCNGSRISGRLLSPQLPDVRRYMSTLASRKYIYIYYLSENIKDILKQTYFYLF